MRRLLLAATFACCATQAGAQPVSLETGERAVPLVELFTSQGCSSCPPADRWLSALGARSDLWSEFVPLAWHVDYWDGLGWKDPFASPDHSARQRAYERAGRLSAVYTPGVLVSGGEWTGWRRGAALPGAGDRVGRVQVRIDDGRARVRFSPGPDAGPGPWIAQLAVLGTGLETPVGRGENRGRTLHEDFVVLGWTRGGVAPGSSAVWELALPAQRRADGARHAVAVWVARPDDPAPVQAVGGWLDPAADH
jgi:hypothetical protein